MSFKVGDLLEVLDEPLWACAESIHWIEENFDRNEPAYNVWRKCDRPEWLAWLLHQRFARKHEDALRKVYTTLLRTELKQINRGKLSSAEVERRLSDMALAYDTCPPMSFDDYWVKRKKLIEIQDLQKVLQDKNSTFYDLDYLVSQYLSYSEHCKLIRNTISWPALRKSLETLRDVK